MFTPVSSQAQAFVPAHAAYPHLRNTPSHSRSGLLLYGAHGQPLPPQQQPDATLPPPQGLYHHPYGGPPPPLDSRGVHPVLAPPIPQDVSRGKRSPNDATMQPTISLPPLIPSAHQASSQRQIPGRRASGTAFEYPDPTNLAPVTPTFSTTPSYQPHSAPSPYIATPKHDGRPSPQSFYSYENRHTTSPHASPFPPIQTPTPVSNASNSVSSRGGLNVRDMLNPGDQPGRSSTDSDMLNALNRRGLSQ